MDFTLRLVDLLTAPAKAASTTISGLDKAMTLAGKASDVVQKKIGDVGKAIGDLAKKATAPIANALNPVIEKAKALGAQIAAPYKAAAEKASAFGNRVKDAVTNTKAYQLGAAGLSKIGGALEGVGSKALSVGKGLVGSIGGGIKSVGSGAMSLLSKIGPLGAAGLAIGAAVAVGSFAKLAIGEKGMAKLSAVGNKFTNNLKGMFKGINIDPLLNALNRMVNLFSSSTNTGKMLGSTLSGAFNLVASLMDTFSKVSEVAFIYILIGFQKLRLAWINLQIWALPIVWKIQSTMKTLQPTFDLIKEAVGKLWNAFKDLGSSFDITKGSAEGIGQVLSDVLVGAVDFALIAVNWLIDAVKDVKMVVDGAIKFVSAVFKGDWAGAWSGAKDLVKGAAHAIIDLFFGAVEVITGGIDLIGKAFGKDLGLTAKVDGWRKDMKKGLDDMTSKNVKDTDKGGKDTGKSLGDGMILGLKDKNSEIFKAGKAAGKAAIAGAKEGADVHSPSRKMAWLGGMMGEGIIVGMESKEGEINTAAKKSLIPNDIMLGSPAFSSGSSGSSGGNGYGKQVQITFMPGSITGSNAEEIADSVVRKIMDNYSDEVAISMGAN